MKAATCNIMRARGRTGERERIGEKIMRIRERRGAVCMNALLPLFKKLPKVRKKKCLRYTPLKPRVKVGWLYE